MATWPTLESIKARIDQTGADMDGEHALAGDLAAAIEQVKLDVGDWDEASDVPSSSLSRAAFLLAIRVAKAPAEAVIADVAHTDPAYGRLLKGHRRRFAIA
jgi:hypothetical protein